MSVAPEADLLVLRAAMGISRGDFLRVMPSLLGEAEMQVAEACVRAQWPDGWRLEARLVAEGERRIAALRLPVADVELRFVDAPGDWVRAFMQRFDRAFHKGGG
ncbi:MAG: hypothetical protein K2Y51_03225 [Gammaproteobacteria bacterium]|nr:hypothetical protein [Gammaproteobacteria bacterium]